MWLCWSLKALTNGEYLDACHDGLPWTPADELNRSTLSTRKFGFQALVLQLRGNWRSEFAHSVGFANWNSRDRPCFMCDASQDLLCGLLRDANALSCPFNLKTNVSYDAECAACEISVTLVSAAQRDTIRSALYYDKRRNGSLGRCLMFAILAFNLLENDRLEPTRTLPDVGAFDMVADSAGRTWDFRRADDRARARRQISEEKPYLVIGSPPCTSFSRLNANLNRGRVAPRELQRRQAEGRLLLNFAAEVYRDQLARGAHFLHEHPLTATSWDEPAI